MGVIIPILGIIFLAGILVYIGLESDYKNIQPSFSEAEELLRSFGNTGELIAFDLDPQPPITEFIYEEIIEEQTLVDENGTETVVNVTTIEKIPTSEITASMQDRGSGIKVCKQGYQCDITGRVVLVDPSTNIVITPPHSILFTFDCDFRDLCNLNPIGRQLITDGAGQFKTTWVSNFNDSIGSYQAFIRATSQFKDGFGQPIVREHNLTIELVK